jgi:transposase
MRAEPIGGRHR